MTKQLFYDKNEGCLWYEEDGQAKFYEWVQLASDDEVERSIDRIVPDELRGEDQ